MTRKELGWSDGFEREFTPYYKRGWVPARLIRDNRITFGALLEDGEEREVVMSGKVYHDAESDAELPAVGDWVALDLGTGETETVIRARLPRKSSFSRKAPGKSTEEQVLAANIDVVVVVTDAGVDFNVRRLERYFTLIGRSGCRAVVLVNKADLYPGAQNEEVAGAIRAVNAEAEVHLTCAVDGSGVDVLRSYLDPGVSLALIGSSGVGKSTLLNQLAGEELQWTEEVNDLTGKGLHATTARELVVLPRGGILIDNPGIREVHMWTDEATLRERFADIEALAGECRFHDCKHGADAGCAIQEALRSGELAEDRYEGFLKLDEEIEQLRRRRKKRRMNLERRAKRDHKIKARNRADRRDLERDLDPR